MSNKQHADIIIIGAGMAGSIAAYLLGRKNLSVILLDRNQECPPIFRAEKLEPDQIELLRKFDLLEARRPYSEPIGKIQHYESGVLSSIDTNEQYGMRYHETVNQIRRQASELVDFRVAQVKDVDVVVDGENIQHSKVILKDETVLTSKLIIMACGYRSSLLSKLNVEVVHDTELHSNTIGFDIEPINDKSFNFKGFNYHLDVKKTGIDYLTLFQIKDAMRANLFTQLAAKDPRAIALRKNPYESLKEYFPELIKHIGEFKISSKVETFITNYYQVKSWENINIVMIGDVFQSVSPTTGTGLSKVLNDVDVLCNVWLPKWLAADSVIKNDDIAQYYQDPQKIKIDKSSLEVWHWYQKQYLMKNHSKLKDGELIYQVLRRLRHFFK